LDDEIVSVSVEQTETIESIASRVFDASIPQSQRVIKHKNVVLDVSKSISDYNILPTDTLRMVYITEEEILSPSEFVAPVVAPTIASVVASVIIEEAPMPQAEKLVLPIQEVVAKNTLKKLDKNWTYIYRYAGAWNDSAFEPVCTFSEGVDFPQTFPHFLPVHEMFSLHSPSIVRENGSKSILDGVCLFRSGVIPDYKYEINGKRTTLSAWSMLIASGSMSFEKLIARVWEITCFAIMGEEIDPAECICGAILENRTNSKTNSINLEVWFSVRSDAICIAILEKLRQVMDEAMIDRF
jgi:hypothetical protein